MSGQLAATWWIVVVCIVVLGFTNGLGATLAMRYVKKEVHAKKRDSTGKLMSLLLILGTLIGTALDQAISSV